jgi:hypothetical protein
MPFEQQSPYPFTVAGTHAKAPAAAGVYGLVNSARWIYIGQSDNLKEELLRHLLSSDDSVLKWGPTGFVFEVCSGQSRQIRVDSLLREYVPICSIGATLRHGEAEKVDKTDSPLRFILKGFSQSQGVRRYDFEGIGKDYGRSQFTVCADVNLVRVYGIAMQELPLLCLELLERTGERDTDGRLVFTEDQMRQHRDQRLAARAAAAQRKKAPRRPSSPNVGNAWRASAQPAPGNRA